MDYATYFTLYQDKEDATKVSYGKSCTTSVDIHGREIFKNIRKNDFMIKSL